MVQEWRDAPDFALIGANSGSDTLKWKLVVAFPSTDYGEFIVWSLYVTGAFTALFLAILIRLFWTMHNLRNPPESLSVEQHTTGSVDNFENQATVNSKHDSGDPLAVKETPLQAYQNREIEKVHRAIRFTLLMWVILWTWW